jgi:hypothetical protein
MNGLEQRKRTQEQCKLGEDRCLDEAWLEMQQQPFAPSAWETIASFLVGLVWLEGIVGAIVLGAVVLYAIGRTVAG